MVNIGVRDRVESRAACSLLLALALVAACGDSARVRSSEKQLSSFAFLAVNNPGLAIDVTAPISGGAVAAMGRLGSGVSGLAATFRPPGASVSVAGVAQHSGASHNDFRTTVVYRVVAED